jgi:uncharacterized membrane protein
MRFMMALSEKAARVNTRIYLLIIVVIAAFLRLLYLNYQSLWYDELHSVIPTAPGESIAAIIEYGKFDQPPGFFLLLHYWFKLFAYNEVYARLLSALIGIAGVGAMFFLGKEFKNSLVGLYAAFITAINYFHLYYSQEVRFYGLLFLLTALSYAFFLKAYKTTRIPYFGLYALCGIGLVYIHYYGMFVLFIQFLTFFYLITTHRQNTRFILYGIGAGVVILLGFSPWIPVVLDDYADRVHWMTLPEWFFPFMYYYIYLGKDPFLAVVYIILAYRFVKYALKQKNKEQPEYAAKVHLVVLALSVVLSYLIPLIYSFVKKPILHERYTIIALPALFILVSLGISLIPKRQIRTAVLAAIFISTILNLLFFNRYYTRITKNQFREITQEVLKRNTNHAKVYSDQAWHYGFYFNQYKAPYQLNETLGVNFNQALATERQVWVLRGHILKGVDETQQQYLDQHYDLIDQVVGHGAAAFLYQRK